MTHLEGQGEVDEVQVQVLQLQVGKGAAMVA